MKNNRTGLFLQASLLCVLVATVSLPGLVRADVVLFRTGLQSEPSIATSLSDPAKLIVGTSEVDANGLNFFLNFNVSSDGGSTWKGGQMPPTNKPKQADPAVGFDRQRNVWYVGLTYSKVFDGTNQCDASLFAMKNNEDLIGSDSFSSGWQPPEYFMPAISLFVCNDKPALAVDNSACTYDGLTCFNGTLYVSWTRFNGDRVHRDVFLTYRDPNTGWRVFGTEFQLSSDISSHFSSVAVGPDGNVYVTWVSVATPVSLYVSRFERSTGNPPTGPVRVASLSGAVNDWQVQSVTADQEDPNVVYVVYENRITGATRTHTDLFLAKSIDRGATWSPPMRVNNDPTETDQFMPWITSTKRSSVIGVGRVDIVFYDKRNDPTLNSVYETWLAFSPDKGVTIAPNSKVSDNQYAATVRLKEYIGVAASPRRAHPAWTGSTDFTLAQDIITDKVEFFDVEVRAFWLDGTPIVYPGPGASVDRGIDNFAGCCNTPVAFSVNIASHEVRVSPCWQTGSFDHWKDEAGNVLGTSNAIILSVDRDRALRAYFNPEPRFCGGSVAHGTLITMADGSRVPVQNLSPGQTIIVYDVPSGYQTTALVQRVVVIPTNSSLVIQTTAPLPFRTDVNPHKRLYVLVNGQPVLTPVTEIQVGDRIYHYDIHSWVEVTSTTQSFGGQWTMYDIVSDPVLEYIANGYSDFPVKL